MVKAMQEKGMNINDLEIYKPFVSSKNIVAVSTTTGLKSPYRVWGKNLELLSCLTENGGLTIREIANKTFIKEKIVRIYCVRNLKRGLVESSLYSGFLGFRLSPLGLIVLEYNNNNNNKITQQIGNKQVTNRQQISHLLCFNNNKEIQNNSMATENIQTKQLSLKVWQGEHTEFEVVVVDTLITHFKKTGSKYLYSRDFDPEKLQIPPNEIKEAIAKLKRDGVLYTFVDKHLQKLKVGLKDSFIKNMDFV